MKLSQLKLDEAFSQQECVLWRSCSLLRWKWKFPPRGEYSQPVADPKYIFPGTWHQDSMKESGCTATPQLQCERGKYKRISTVHPFSNWLFCRLKSAAPCLGNRPWPWLLLWLRQHRSGKSWVLAIQEEAELHQRSHFSLVVYSNLCFSPL